MSRPCVIRHPWTLETALRHCPLPRYFLLGKGRSLHTRLRQVKSLRAYAFRKMSGPLAYEITNNTPTLTTTCVSRPPMSCVPNARLRTALTTTLAFAHAAVISRLRAIIGCAWYLSGSKPRYTQWGKKNLTCSSARVRPEIAWLQQLRTPHTLHILNRISAILQTQVMHKTC